MIRARAAGFTLGGRDGAQLDPGSDRAKNSVRVAMRPIVGQRGSRLEGGGGDETPPGRYIGERVWRGSRGEGGLGGGGAPPRRGSAGRLRPRHDPFFSDV